MENPPLFPFLPRYNRGDIFCIFFFFGVWGAFFSFELLYMLIIFSIFAYVLKRFYIMKKNEEIDLVLFGRKLAHSIELLQHAEELALRYSPNGYYLAFSGGKDSQALYHVAQMAGVKFDAHFSLTTIDPPEQVRFVRRQYPDVIIDRPSINFANLCIKKKALPTRMIRFCCSELKEVRGAGRVVLTGVRKSESYSRSKRGEAEIVSRNVNNRYSGTFEQFDEFTRSKEIEDVQCVRGKDKIVINPLIYWQDADVWHFLNNVAKVPHCELYDNGFRRIGCLFCPMSSRKEMMMCRERYPKYYRLFIRLINRLRSNGYLSEYSVLTDEEVFEWWMSKESLQVWFAKNKSQMQIPFDLM